jgi:hypothetical protein
MVTYAHSVAQIISSERLSTPPFNINFLKHYENNQRLMAKTASKPTAKAPKKTTAAKPATSSAGSIEKVCVDALEKLKALNIQQPLQNDIEWCLGSYRSDGNPVGLYDMAERALIVFQEERAKKTKGVSAKTISDLEKVLSERPQ